MEPDHAPDPRLAALGNRLARARKRAGLNQKELAERMGRGESTVSTWERGLAEMGAIDLMSACAALDVDPGVLLGQRSEQLGLDRLRKSVTYLVRREAVRRVTEAKTIEELRDLFNYGIEVGFVVPPDAEEVETEEWGRIAELIQVKLQRLGPIPDTW